jgi:hypothetical protein
MRTGTGTGAMRCDAILACFEACYMLVSGLAEAEVGGSGEKTLIERERITAHLPPRYGGFVRLELSGRPKSVKTSGSGSIPNSPLDRSTTAASVPLPQRKRSG